MRGEDEAVRVPLGLGVVVGVDGATADVVGPAIPSARLELPQDLGRAEHGPAAARVVTVVGDVDAVGALRDAERIAETPGDELEARPVGTDAHRRPGARDLAFDRLARGARRAEREI